MDAIPGEISGLMVSDPDPRHGGRLQGEFRYLPDYLDRPDAFPLDPMHLPLQAQPFEAGRPHAGIHGVFEDSLPDDWGRRILSQRHQLSRSDSRPANLLALLGDQAMGALAFSASAELPPRPQAVPATELSALMAAARKFEQWSPQQTPDELMRLFQAASSPGGARPKVLVDENGIGWLVKLASSQDRYDMVRIETASLALAQAAGLDVPEHRLIDLNGHSTLMLRHFDHRQRWPPTYHQHADPARRRGLLQRQLQRPGRHPAPGIRPTRTRPQRAVSANAVQCRTRQHRRPPEKHRHAARRARLAA